MLAPAEVREEGSVSRQPIKSAIVAACALWLMPAIVGAADSEDRDAARFEKMAKRAYHEKRYDDAIAAFEAAFEQDPLPKYLYNIGRCHEKEGALDDAIGFLERYLEEDPAAVDREQVDAHIEVLRKKLEKTHGELKVWSKPPGSLVQVNGPGGEQSGSTPYVRWFAFGEYTIKVSREGHEAVAKQVVIQPNTPASVVFELAETGGDKKGKRRKRRKARTSDGPGRFNWPAWAAVGAGIVAVGGGVAVGALALSDANARDDLLGRPITKEELPAREQEATELDDSARTKGLVSNVLYGVGGLAIAGGVALLLLSGDDEPSSTATGLVPTAGGLLLVWEGSL